ncbi:MAG: DUF2752 domain-containing protein [Verrucomicrobiota bacterium]
MVVASAVGLVFHFVNPTQAAWLPACPLHTLTGWNCPGCGTTRALHQLACGHPVAAFRLNPLTVLALPVAGLWLARRERPAIKPVWLWLGIGALLAFGVLRNLPITFLNPQP